MFLSFTSSSLIILSGIKAAKPKFDSTVRNFSKFLSKSAAKRIPLTTKRARKGFYKGKGCTKEGYLTSKGRFVVDWSKRLQLIIPDLTGFKLKPVRSPRLWVSMTILRNRRKKTQSMMLAYPCLLLPFFFSFLQYQYIAKSVSKFAPEIRRTAPLPQ